MSGLLFCGRKGSEFPFLQGQIDAWDRTQKNTKYGLEHRIPYGEMSRVADVEVMN
jgi:hypothetical protein